MKALGSLFKSIVRNITIAVLLVTILAHVTPFIALFTGASKASLQTTKIIFAFNGVIGLYMLILLYYLIRNNEKYWPILLKLIILLFFSTTVYRFLFASGYTLNQLDLANAIFYSIIAGIVYLDHWLQGPKKMVTSPAVETDTSSKNSAPKE